MKNIVKSLFVLLSVFAISCSTDDVQDRPVIQGVDAPILTAPEDGNTYTLLPENMDALAERFVWTAANYNGNVAINYSVEMDLTGGDFSNAQVLGGTSGDLQAPVTVETLNNACIALGATPYEARSFDIRVVSSAGGSSTAYSPMISNIVTIIITPFPTDLPKIWMPGGFQTDSNYGNNWDHSTAPQLAASDFGKTDFEGYVYINSIQDHNLDSNQGFKFSTQADWNGTNFGDDQSGSFSILSSSGVNIDINAGYYRIKANTGDITTENPDGLTYSATSTTWGIIGDATGSWDNSTPLTYNTSTKKWEGIVTLTTGQFKFRANNAWDINLGPYRSDASGNEYAGEEMSYGGTVNFESPGTGTYLVELNLSNPREYTYTLTPQ